MAIKKAHLLYRVAIIVLVLDLLTKFLIRESLSVGEKITVLPFFSIAHVQNLGIAFGLLLFDFMRWVLIIIAFAVALGIFWSCKHKKLKEHYLAWGLIAGGALGNAIDRIFYGVVTDFINFSFWPAFNVADSALTIGVIILIWHAFRKE